MKYSIVQIRKTENVDYETVIKSSDRIKEARGMAKTLFHSQLEVMVKHSEQYDCDDFTLDEENRVITCFDDGKQTFYYKVEVRENAP